MWGQWRKVLFYFSTIFKASRQQLLISLNLVFKAAESIQIKISLDYYYLDVNFYLAGPIRHKHSPLIRQYTGLMVGLFTASLS